MILCQRLCKGRLFVSARRFVCDGRDVCDDRSCPWTVGDAGPYRVSAYCLFTHRRVGYRYPRLPTPFGKTAHLGAMDEVLREKMS